ARPHEDSNLVLQFNQVLLVRSFDEYDQLQVRHEQIPESAEWDKNKIVLAHTKGGTHLFRHTHHGEVMPSHRQFLANRIDRGEELIHDVLPNEANPRIVVVVLIADVAPPRHLFPADISVAGGNSQQVHLFDRTAAKSRLRPALRLRNGADGLVTTQGVHQVLVFFETDGPVAPQGFQVLL